MNDKISSYGRQNIDEDDVAAVVRVLHSERLTQGPETGAFEREFATRTGAAEAVVCNSGTAALHLAVLAGGIGPGDTAVVPAVTFLATANAVRLAGGDVVFADVDPETGLMGPQHLEQAMARANGAIKAVLPVHLNGQACDMEAIAAIAVSANAVVIDDAAHALGGNIRRSNGNDVYWEPIGGTSLSRFSCFSFHPVKTITMGEGGAVTTGDADAADFMRRARSHGMTRDPAQFENRDLAFDGNGTPNPWYYEAPEIGLNYRVTDLQCALGRSQLAKLDGFIARRQELVDAYRDALSALSPIVRPLPVVPWSKPAWHLAVALIDFDAARTERSAVMTRLQQRGVGTQVHYLPVCHQPYYRQRYGTTDVPGADAYYRRILSLPLFPGLDKEDVARTVDELAQALGLR